MGPSLKLCVAVSLALCFAVSPGGMAVEPGMKPSCQPDTVLENEEVRVWFQGLKGHIKVFDQDRSDPDGGVYTYKTVRVAEVRGDEVVAELDLSRALPHNSSCQVWDTMDGVLLRFFAQDQVLDGDGNVLGHPGVTFLYELNETSKSAKFDLYVNNWPWGADDSELVFDFQIHTAYDVQTAANGVGFQEDGEDKGYMTWADTAHVSYEDGREAESVVEGKSAVRGNTVDVRLRYGAVEAGYEDLEYDPWVGVGAYDIIAGRIVPDEFLDHTVPKPLRPLYGSVKELLPGA